MSGKRATSAPDSSDGVVATARMDRKTDATREAPFGGVRVRQPATREGQAGPDGVADKPVVPLMSGNSGGGKGLWFRVNGTRGEERETGDEPASSG